MLQVNYGDGDVGRNDDGSWQDNLSDYNSDFSVPTDDDQGDDDFDEKNDDNDASRSRRHIRGQNQGSITIRLYAVASNLRPVQTERVIRNSIGQFLRTRKMWSVRKLSILLRKRMHFTQVWTSL